MIILWKNWESISVRPLEDGYNFYGKFIRIAAFTRVLYRHKKTGKLKTVDLEGHWTLNDVKGLRNG